ncbi:MAG: hypothetical protein K5656_10865 [Lachnospiraceae bacterium]|nr:hypothetical protein [Lachnospiraceae bacterium]
MKNIVKRVFALIMAVAVCLSFSNISKVSEKKTVNATKDSEELSEALDGNQTESDFDKVETVYVKSNPDGSINNITVSDWLKNPDGASVLKDSSDLKDIVNVKGKEEFTNSGDNYEWQANGNDIYYQGTTDKELPVDVKISYYLDGNEVSADEIAGKSGDVEIKFNYENKEKKTVKVDNTDYTVNVPFTVMSGMILSGDNFTNVEVDNGKVISDGDKNIVVGVAMPGLYDSLKLADSEKTKDIDIPDSVSVKAKASEFKLDMTMTVITTDMLDSVDIENVSSIDELKDDLNDLNDASTKLKDGTDELSKGADKLDSSFSEYSDGVETLVNGLNSAETGVNKLYNGSVSLENGSKKLDKGLGSLKKGAKSFKDGTDKLDSGAESIKTGANKLNAGAKNLSDGLDSFKKSFDDGVTESKKNTKEYLTNNTAKEITEVVTNAVNTAATTAATTSSTAVVTTIADSVANSGNTIGASIRASVSDQTKATELATGLVKAGVISKEEIPTMTKLLTNETLTNMLGNNIATGISTNIKASASDSSSAQSKALSEAIAANVNKALGDSVVNGVSSSLNNLGAFLNKQTDASKAQVDSVLSISDDYKTSGNATTLKDGADALSKGTKELSSGASKFRTGVSSLSDGADDIYDGASQLKSGSSKLSTGANTLKNGIFTLKSGTGTLKAGGLKLNNATDLIADGIHELDKGSIKLSNGMAEFDKDGIKVLYNTVDKDLKQLLDRVEAVKKAAKEYQTFTKINDDVSGEVKFIIETTAVKANSHVE